MGKLFLIVQMIFCVLSVVGCSSQGTDPIIQLLKKDNNIEDSLFAESRKIAFQQELQKAKSFLKNNKSYNQTTVFLIDMRIPSGQFRFFCVDNTTDTIFEKGLVAHGSGSDYSSDSLIFSNTPNSYKTSLGKYKIGKSYSGNFGKSYKLHGLESTNSNAYKRYIVLHPYSCVPNEEQTQPICLSLGCPMVSDYFMEKLYTIIDNSPKPILMVIYY